MVHSFGKDAQLIEQSKAELLDDIESTHRDSMQAARDLSTLRVQAGVEVRPANACDRSRLVTTGQTTELRRRGAKCIVDQPVLVGSVFHLSFDPEVLDLAPALAVCDRCAMLSDEAFEVRFQFCRDVELPQARPQT